MKRNKPFFSEILPACVCLALGENLLHLFKEWSREERPQLDHGFWVDQGDMKEQAAPRDVARDVADSWE